VDLFDPDEIVSNHEAAGRFQTAGSAGSELMARVAVGLTWAGASIASQSHSDWPAPLRPVKIRTTLRHRR